MEHPKLKIVSETPAPGLKLHKTIVDAEMAEHFAAAINANRSRELVSPNDLVGLRACKHVGGNPAHAIFTVQRGMLLISFWKTDSHVCFRLVSFD